MDLEELEKLERAATPAPWVGYYNDTSLKRGVAMVDTAGSIIEASPRDAAFIAAARNAMPELLRRQRILMNALREIRDGWPCACYPRKGECPRCIAEEALTVTNP